MDLQLHRNVTDPPRMSRTKKQANWRYLAGELGLGDELPISLNNENHKFG